MQYSLKIKLPLQFKDQSKKQITPRHTVFSFSQSRNCLKKLFTFSLVISFIIIFISQLIADCETWKSRVRLHVFRRISIKQLSEKYKIVETSERLTNGYIISD